MRRLHLLGLVAALLPAGSAFGQSGFATGAPQIPTAFVQTGYSSLLRAGYMTPVSPRLALGGELILDLADFGFLRSEVAGRFTTVGAFKLKAVLTENQDWVVNLTFTPGVGVQVAAGSRIDPVTGAPTDTGLFALLLSTEVAAGYKLDERFTLGGGVRVPILVALGPDDLDAASIPILLGPVVDYRLDPHWALYGALQIGPAVLAGGSTLFDLGLEASVGLTFSP